jgi:DmsE family decaheme c-type cytochrome
MAVTKLKAFFILCGALLVSYGAGAEDGPGCLDCHKAGADSAVHAVFNTVHGSLQGGGAASCTACHGPSEAHDRRGKKASPDVSFGPLWISDAQVRNASCQGCHENEDLLLWTGSSHQQEDLTCNDCHSVHQPDTLALDDDASQQLCLNCHTQVRAQLHLPSRHPIAEGKTACIDCHNPHGGTGDADLHQVTLNDNCFSCHQDKRGPFLWEHPPAAEDCALCHRPHGSVNEPLLNARGPALCQQCHAAAFHPSVPYGSEGLPSGSANQNVLGKNCMNCHSQVHGSNHPSGARLTR